MQAPRCRMRSELVEHCHPAHGSVARQGSEDAFKWPLRFRAILTVALVSLACLTTDGGLLSGARRVAFAQAAPASPRLVDGNGTPLGGWWALAPSSQCCRIVALARWKPTAAMNTPHSLHTATLLPSGQVLVAGGWTGSWTAASEVYTPVTGQWTLTAPVEHDIYFWNAATLLPSGQVLVAGNTSTELYNPATGQWTQIPYSPYSTFLPTATLLPSGQVLLAGGGPGELRPLRQRRAI
jgi:hypothetical protein